jgi:hypothetical protein
MLIGRTIGAERDLRGVTRRETEMAPTEIATTEMEMSLDSRLPGSEKRTARRSSGSPR